jgi:GxxExxY protein
MSQYDPATFPHRDITEKIIGVFYDVYNELGFGFLESVYHRAMVIALTEAGLVAESKVKLPVYFRGQVVGDFEADLLVERHVILELKAVEELCSAHEAQTLNYLKASAVEVGLLLKFGPKPRITRLAFSNERKRSRPSVVLDCLLIALIVSFSAFIVRLL